MTRDVDTDDAASTHSRSTRLRAVDATDTGTGEATPTSRTQQDYRRLSRDRRQAARNAARLREPEKARTKKLDRQGKWRDGWGEYCNEPGPGDIVRDPLLSMTSRQKQGARHRHRGSHQLVAVRCARLREAERTRLQRGAADHRIQRAPPQRRRPQMARVPSRGTEVERRGPGKRTRRRPTWI